jgi:hypothetical protein
LPRYWKAYDLEALRRYPGWSEAEEAPSVVYLDESFAVRMAPTVEAPVVFSSTSSDWLHFCRDDLAFATPDWEAEAARVRDLLIADAARAE